MKEIKITYNELMKDLDKYRDRSVRQEFTKEQIAFLEKCRNHSNPVSFRKMAELWEQIGWGKICETSLNTRYAKLKRQ